MAYVNVKDWSVDQVTDWLKGLDNVLIQYNTSFLNNGVTGHQLLNLRADDLEHLGVKSLGHQEIILEAVEHLRNFHFELDKENLQTLALKLSCAANSLYKELLLVDDDCPVVQTQVMSDVHSVITTIKPLVCWLDRSPFIGDKEYIDNKTNLLQLAFEMATNAHRGIFSEKPIVTIRGICEKLSKIADHIIQELMDPMILQPASLDLATLKKKEQELGFFILPCNHAIHQIADIKHGSPAHTSTKIEEGDEIVQVNYQTVVGWQRKKVLMLLQESPPEIVLTLKKRPRHTKVYGQIYMKPYRLPSKKRNGQNWSSRWYDNIPSPRLLPILDLPTTKPIIKIAEVDDTQEVPDVETELSSSDSEPPDSPLDVTGRMYPLKPRPILQRRHTITGTTPTNKRPYPSIEQYWEFIKSYTSASSSNAINSSKFEDSNFLRDKSASCTMGLDLSPRPTTVIGLAHTNSKKSSANQKTKRKVNFEDHSEKKSEHVYSLIPETSNLAEEKSISVNSLASLKNEDISFIDEGRELTDRTSMTSDLQKDIIECKSVTKKEIVFPEVSVHDMIKKFDEQKSQSLNSKLSAKTQIKKPPEVPQKPEGKIKPAVPPRKTSSVIRGRLDKSYSTPAYDLTDENPDKEESLPNYTVIPDKIVNDHLDTPHLENYELPVSPKDVTAAPPQLAKEVDFPESYIELENIDVPPKPPPRNAINFKPAYPASSPKPVSGNKSNQKDIQKFPSEYSDPKNLDISTEGEILEEKQLSKLSFEPKVISTPVKCDTESPTFKTITNYESQKSLNEKKVSPTNSIVKAMIKGKTGKKKNTLIAKRRRVSVNELSSVAEIQGYLYQRLRTKQTQNVHWEKRWFVLSGSCLYGFTTKEDTKAACLIFLSGFTVAVASEVRSRANAFKVYHTGTVFYFSTDDSDTLHSWIDLIRAATLHNNDTKQQDSSLYSETDESDCDKPKSVSEKNDSLKKFGSLKKFTTKKSSENPQSGSTSLDRKWFFNKSSSQSKNSLPVPTAQFRSYRKIRTTPIDSSITTGNFTSHIPFFAPQNPSQNVSVPNLTIETVKSEPSSHPLRPVNYIHASNPSLYNRTDFISKPSFKPSNENLAGFVTLEELMRRQTEERKMNPHHIVEEVTKNLNLITPDVVYGEVPIKIKDFDQASSTSVPKIKTPMLDDQPESSSSCFGKRLGSLKRNSNKNEDLDVKTSTYPKTTKGSTQKINRSLPRTHKIQDNYIDYETPRSSTREREHSLEMIYCPKTVTDVHYALNRPLDDTMYFTGSKKGSKVKKQKSFSSSDKKPKSSGKIQDSSTSKVKLKSATQYTPMALPLSQDSKSKPKFAFELNLDEKSQKGNKLKQIFGSKSESKKEKTFLGSPKLHRAIFGQRETNVDTNWLPSSDVSSFESTDFLDTSTPIVSEAFSMNINPQADYPGLEYPPVFEPETYSLANPQSNILRKQNSN